MFEESWKMILAELHGSLSKIDGEQVAALVQEIEQAKTIVVAGAGRVGMAVRGFGMRLGHLGYRAYSLGDSTVPSIGSGDLLLVASGSGETQTILDIVRIAVKNGARISLVTGRKDSQMGKLANTVVELRVPSKVPGPDNLSSVQPMTTLNEQVLQILFDATVLELMKKTGETHESMWARHSNLE